MISQKVCFVHLGFSNTVQDSLPEILLNNMNAF